MNNRFNILSILLLSFLYLGIGNLNGQILTIDNSIIEHNDRSRACIQVQMEPTPKEVKKAWDDYLKDEYDVNLKGIGFLTNKDILSAEAVAFPEVSKKELSLYTRVIEKGDITEMCVFAALGYDIYLNKEEYPEEYSRLQGIVEDFVGTYLPDHYKELVENTEKELEDLINQQQDLSDDISDNEKEIDKLQQENREMSKELIDVKAKTEELSQQLEARKEKVMQLNRQLKKNSIN